MLNSNTANKKLMKKMNTNAILNVIRVNGNISRADIAKKLKLTPATVSANVNDLLEQGLIIEKGEGVSKGGRKPILLALNHDSVFIIGVHTKVTGVNVGVMNLVGKIVYKQEYHFPYVEGQIARDTIIDTIIHGIEDCVEQSLGDYKDVVGIGLGLHGLVDPEQGKSIFAPSYKWHNVNIAEIISEHFDIYTYVDNDVRAMALGEKWFGDAKDVANYMFLNIGEGIGGAIVTNGQLYYGASHGAGEVGHIKVTERKLYCECGNYGCLTTVASEKAVMERVKNSIVNDANTKMTVEQVHDLTIENVVNMAKYGNIHAVEVLNKTYEYIGRAIGVLINVINPEKIFIIGHVFDDNEEGITKIIEAAKESALVENHQGIIVRESAIKKDIEIIGAATLILNRLFTH